MNERIATPANLPEKELEAFLDEFDLDLLKRLIEERLEGIRLSHPINLVPKNQVSLLNSPDHYGFQNPLKMSIGLNVKDLDSDVPDPEERKAVLEHIFIHEQIHAASISDVTYKTGFVSFSLMRRSPGFIIWNEAVTEKFAREILDAYESSTGDRKAKVRFPIFEGPLNFLEEFIKRVSTATGFDEKVVWDALIRAYFVEGTINDEDLGGLFPEGFFESLRNLKLDDLAQGLGHVTMRAEVQNMIRREMEKPEFIRKIEDFIAELRHKLFGSKAA